MARKPPPEHTRFKPGHSGNVSGRPKNLLTADKVASLIAKLWGMTASELEVLIKADTTTMGEAVLISVLQKAKETGDFSRVEGLLTRGVGKVKEVSEVHQHNYDEELRKVDREKIVALLKEA